jgi:hypothetical protein
VSTCRFRGTAGRRLWTCLSGECVAHAVHGAKKPWVFRVILKRLAQLGDHRGNGRIGHEGGGPEAVPDSLPRHHGGAKAQQQVKKSKGFRTEMSHVRTPPELARCGIEDEIAKAEGHLADPLKNPHFFEDFPILAAQLGTDKPTTRRERSTPRH